MFAPYATGETLLGIRFKGLDVSKPFVDVVATTSVLTAAEQIHELRDIATEAYAVFRPGAVRFTVLSPRSELAFEGAGTWEKKFVAGSLREMTSLPTPTNLDRVRLRPAADLRFFDDYIEEYRMLLQENPQHAEYATADDREDLEFYLASGSVFEVLIDDVWAGIVAGHRDVDACLDGFRITENLLTDEYRSKGFSRAVQRRLAEAINPACGVLFGTIHIGNLGAYNAAIKSGRVDVGGYSWVLS